MNRKQIPGLPAMAAELLRLGALAFGGLGATLALLQRGLVDRRQWLQQRDISEALAFTKALPGSTGVQVVAYLGWRLHGWPGAIIAAAAFIAPAAALMTAVAAGSLALPDQPWVRGALAGVQVGVVGLLAAAMWRLARSEAGSPVLAVVLVASCVLGFFVHAVVIVVGAGLIGALLGGGRGDG
ncbi:MAG: chromate transporter [Betaproteobacteria bacterium]|nr:chromate transporter [Betaproteobacteria bacterium]